MPVSDKREIIIKDACILFDLVDLNLLQDFFQLEFIALTTPQVIGEITNEVQWAEISKYVDNGKLQVENNGTYEAIASLKYENPGLSLPDCSVLELALRKNAIVYSSDGSLRKTSIKKQLTVRGILWIIDELLSKMIINDETAIKKLIKYEKINDRAPVKDIQLLLTKIKSK